MPRPSPTLSCTKSILRSSCMCTRHRIRRPCRHIHRPRNHSQRHRQRVHTPHTPHPGIQRVACTSPHPSTTNRPSHRPPTLSQLTITRLPERTPPRATPQHHHESNAPPRLHRPHHRGSDVHRGLYHLA